MSLSNPTVCQRPPADPSACHGQGLMAEVHEIAVVTVTPPKRHGAEALARLQQAIANQKELRTREPSSRPVKHRRQAHPLVHPSWWVVSADAELETLVKRRGESSWRTSIVKFFHRHPVQVFFIVLLLLDVVIVFIELFIDAEFPRCSLIIRDATSCCPALPSDHGSVDAKGHSRLRFLASGSSDAQGSMADGSGSGDGSGHGSLCPVEHVIGAAAGCDAHQHAEVHAAHEALFAASVAILSGFALELCLLLIALDLQFFHNMLCASSGFQLAEPPTRSHTRRCQLRDARSFSH